MPWVIVAVFCLLSCERAGESRYVATRGRDAISPSGKYVLHVVNDRAKEEQLSGRFPFYGFEIRLNQPGSPPEYASTNSFIGTHRLVFTWDSRDRVWVYSGDVGPSYWERVAPSFWQQHRAAFELPNGVPELIRRYVED